MEISVIGGSGFIGTRLCARLARKTDANFHIIDKATSQTYCDLTRIADVRSVDALRVHVPEGAVMVNLAAEHRDDVSPRSLYDEVNVQGARNLCTVAREKQVRCIVFTSSVAVYGFAPLGTSESGTINPFNDYGRTKHEAEQVLRAWQQEDPEQRTLVIVRPTVVFGENNRGNVYNLLRQIAVGRFVMVGDGLNRKSMAYVENVAAFIEHSLASPPGVHVFNYVDKPDFAMNDLVALVGGLLGKTKTSRVRLPFAIGLLVGACFDAVAKVSGRKFPISAVRVRKFCANSVYASAAGSSGFEPPVPLDQALKQTVLHEFVAKSAHGPLFYSE
jgi:nucleoside-diphosphate-sugar epimerase